jgi:Major capsid protein Gp23.
MSFKSEQLMEKWAPVMDAPEAPAFADSHRAAVTAVLLENTERALSEERGQAQYLSEAAPANQTGSGINNWDPILISLVRRAMPNLIAYDLCGVQPMTGPTGLVFAMKSRYGAQNGTEAMFDEANTAFSGEAQSATASSDPFAADTDGTPDVGDYFPGTGMSTSDGEALGSGSPAGDFNEMSFSIEKTSVEAKTRALKAEYTMELAQDLKAIHGLDAESELANILSGEILAEINREVVRTINSRAILGAQQSEIATSGTFDLSADADGRWSVEKYKGLLVHIQREANVIAQQTRRGKGNFILVSADVAAALSASGMLDYTPALAGNAGVQSDVTGATLVGTLAGGMKVYLDPYATVNYVTVGYKGSNAYDAGMFYCPYVPLTMVRAVGENTFQPKIGFKTRYGMIANPFTGALSANTRNNEYYRIFKVDNILDAA